MESGFQASAIEAAVHQDIDPDDAPRYLSGISVIENMGFSTRAALEALVKAKGDVQAAVELLM